VAYDLVVIGGGLAGSEAAWQAAERGLKVVLFEMRPQKLTPAHRTGKLAELVCSNSLRAASLTNAVGLLKEEMRRLNSLIIQCADATRIPAGGALAVDRERFSALVTEKIQAHPGIELERKEATWIPSEVPVVIATGPLTSPALAGEIQGFLGEEYLSFLDAVAPIVTSESINREVVFPGSRYGKGGQDYLNCPLDQEEYRRFWLELVRAEVHEGHEFESGCFFEGCLPVEEMARRGEDTLRFGPMKPVGLVDPATGKQPYAVVQLRRDDREGRLYNLVGFQTNLKWGEQKRVFRLVPGLEKAEFARFGVMHLNTFIKAPVVLKATLQTRKREDRFFAGQITGVEGYVESAATGLVAGINAARWRKGKQPLVFPAETAIGALCRYLETAVAESFQPMNITFGLLPPMRQKVMNKKERKERIARRALKSLEVFLTEVGG